MHNNPYHNSSMFLEFQSIRNRSKTLLPSLLYLGNWRVAGTIRPFVEVIQPLGQDPNHYYVWPAVCDEAFGAFGLNRRACWNAPRRYRDDCRGCGKANQTRQVKCPKVVGGRKNGILELKHRVSICVGFACDFACDLSKIAANDRFVPMEFPGMGFAISA